MTTVFVEVEGEILSRETDDAAIACLEGEVTLDLYEEPPPPKKTIAVFAAILSVHLGKRSILP